MLHHWWIPAGLLFTIQWHFGSAIECPWLCQCSNLGDKQLLVRCNEGNLNDTSLAHLLSQIPSNVTHLSIEPPTERPNRFSLTSDLTRFPKLRELKVVRSGINNLGKRMFEASRYLQVLDLSENEIESITEETFENCDQILHLHLDSNLLHRTPLPSSTFVFLRSLQVLSLKDNRLQRLPNNFFNGLSRLQTLQLDGNYLDGIQHDIFSDLPNLTHLTLNHCGLTSIDPNLFNKNPYLVTLELGYNKLVQLPSQLTPMLPNLITLDLRGNFIGFLPNSAVNGSSLKKLVLAENFLGIRDASFTPGDQSIQPMAFLGSQLNELDLSSNHYQIFSSDNLRSVAESLSILHLAGNPLGHISKEQTAGLHKLRQLHLANAGITAWPDQLPYEYFSLTLLNVSGNPLESLSIEDLPQLEVLDISKAKFSQMNAELISSFHNLKKVHLGYNPWNCVCDLRPLLDFLRQFHGRKANPSESITEMNAHKCHTPVGLRNFSLLAKETSEGLGRCQSPIFGASGLTRESEVGILAAGGVLVVLILALILVVGCTYLVPKAATYRTREDSRLNISGISAEHINSYPTTLVKKERLF